LSDELIGQINNDQFGELKHKLIKDDKDKDKDEKNNLFYFILLNYNIIKSNSVFILPMLLCNT